jgi:4-hydroxy-tetrahydrodipicolinate reductase
VTRIAVLGATGRMGRRTVAHILDAPDLRLSSAVTRSGSEFLGRDAGELVGQGGCGVKVGSLGPASFLDTDVVVDFSLPAGTLAALSWLDGVALVTGTTGGGAGLNDALAKYAESAPVLVASNFSAGVAVLTHLVAKAAKSLADFDIEIVEAHHRHKRDAPSGTAKSLGQAAANARNLDLANAAVYGRMGATGERPNQQIGFHSVRGGGVVGDHDVYIAGPGETLILTHRAVSRDTFVEGALRAARWIPAKSAGLHSMADVLGL